MPQLKKISSWIVALVTVVIVAACFLAREARTMPHMTLSETNVHALQPKLELEKWPQENPLDPGSQQRPALESSEKSNGIMNTSTEQKILLPGFNFCAETLLGNAEDTNKSIAIQYICEGPRYDAFAQQLNDFVNKKSMQTASSWGHRQSPIPKDKTVLFFGNSHTRQVALALACQMGVDAVLDVHYFNVNSIDPFMASRIRFRNGASLYMVINSYVAYSPLWEDLLVNQIEKRLIDFDFVVLGVFNVVKGNSTFRKNLENLTQTLPYQFDLRKSPPGPGPDDISKAYDGPFLVLSNMSINQRGTFDRYREQVWELRNQTGKSEPLSLNGRRYIEEIQNEGATRARFFVTDMTVGKRENRDHRCMGKGGGHPDLLAWDIAEILYASASSTKRKSMKSRTVTRRSSL